MQKANDPITADALSTMLFPSFVLWRTGALIGAPFDVLEYVAWRAWQPPTTPTDDEQAEIEYEIDQNTLRSYPVERVYPPTDAAAGPAPASRGG